MKKIYCLLFLIAFSTMFLSAQETNPATGGKGVGSGGVVEYSIGQVFSNVGSGSNGTVVQGVQQPYEILVTTGIENTSITLECKVYPNPTSGIFILSVNTDEFKNLKFVLMDFGGKLIKQDILNDEETEISLENYSSSMYFLKVYNGNIVIKTFKIIKK